MQGFCQWIGERAFIIRLGYDTQEMWHDWIETLTATIEDDGYVMFWAFKGPADRKLVDDFVRAANVETRLPVKWLQNRPPDDPVPILQTSGVNGGKVVMTREHNSKNPIHKDIPDPSTVTSLSEHKKHVDAAFKLAEEGKIRFSDFKETKVDDKTDILSVKRTTV